MPGFIGEDQVRQIKSRIDLVQLMGEYTPLRKSGANFTGCCAFHQERTPSMYVYPDQQTYHCFGCGAHGDAISLLREKERVDFADAIELLAKRAGISIVYQNQGKGQFAQHAKGERDELLAAMEFATRFYEQLLWESSDGAQARAYLASRSLSEAVCRRFRLGWAPGSGRLVDEARRKGLSEKVLLAADLAVDRAGRTSDRFWERVMFPIADRFGNPIAFSARLLPEAEQKAKAEGRGVGKYVNNTDTPLYHKGHAVFNLHRARLASRDRNRLIVMEGPTDVMAADEAGFGECVAVLGTALTSDHARQLGNLVGNQGRLIILLDGDRAGQANSIKAVRTCLAVGVPVRVAVLPDELDPAELLGGDQAAREAGRARLEQVLASGRSDIDHLLRALAPRPYELDSRAKLAVTDQLLEALRPMPDAELRALHVRDVAEYFGIERVRLERRLSGVEARAAAAPAPPGAAPGPAAAELAALSPAQELCLHVLVRCPELREHATDDLGLEPSQFPAPWQELAGHLLLSAGADIHTLAGLAVVQAHGELHQAAFRWASGDLTERVPAVSDPRADLGAAVLEIRRTRLKEQLHRLGRELADCERAGDAENLGRLSRERLSLTRALQDLSGHSGFGSGG
jgi:DNA primase